MLRAVIAILLVTAVAPVHADWEVQRDPFDQGVIARYKAILAKSPHDAGALLQLVGMYRRYRTVDKLVAEYRAALETWSSLVVLALLERADGDSAGALVRFERSAALRDDAATWRNIAQLRTEMRNRFAARAAYEKALALATSTSQQVLLLRDLIRFAQGSSDHEGEERYFTQLVALVPRDASAWIDRGDAMYTAGRFDLARESFAAAEPLLAADPETRIDVIVRGARVLEKIAKPVAAMRELRRAFAMVPPGSYVVRELVGHMIEIRRSAKELPAAIAELEAMWPVPARKHFEWTTLATLYEETKDIPRAIDALKAAVTRSPTETVTQLRLIELLDRNHDTQQALDHMEVVARAQPRDVALQLALARRYGSFDDRAMRTLLGLAKRAAKDPDTLMAIAELYLEWDRNDLAEGELAKIVAMTEASHDPVALGELGARALELGIWKAASNAYLAATKLAPRDPALFTGLAFAYDGLREWDLAFEAAEQVLFLIPDDLAHRAERRTARKNLVQILLRTRTFNDDYISAYREMWAWSFEQDDDVESGYFLAIYYGLSPRDDEPYRTLMRLHVLVPDDKEIEHDLTVAREINKEAIGVFTMQRTHLTDPFPDGYPWSPDRHSDSLDGPRLGIHVGAGAGVRGDMPLTLDLGASLSFRAARHLSLVGRLDWTRRLGDQGDTHAIGASLGLAAHVKTTPSVALLVGAAERFEVRFGDELMNTSWRRTEVATDVMTMLVLRDAPFSVGTRVEAWYSGRVVGLLELGFEWR